MNKLVLPELCHRIKNLKHAVAQETPMVANAKKNDFVYRSRGRRSGLFCVPAGRIHRFFGNLTPCSPLNGHSIWSKKIVDKIQQL
jgi:hypothetical protein